jgi:hypothetical protein
VPCGNSQCQLTPLKFRYKISTVLLRHVSDGKKSFGFVSLELFLDKLRLILSYSTIKTVVWRTLVCHTHVAVIKKAIRLYKCIESGFDCGSVAFREFE